MENIVYTIDEKNQGCRLDKFVSTTMELSRKRVKDLLDQNQIQVNGKSRRQAILFKYKIRYPSLYHRYRK